MNPSFPGDYFVNGGPNHPGWTYSTIQFTQGQGCNPTNAAWPFNDIRVLGHAYSHLVYIDETLLTITATANFCDGTSTNGTLIVKAPAGWGGNSSFVVEVFGDTSLKVMGITGGFDGMGSVHIPPNQKPSLVVPPAVPPPQGQAGYQSYQFESTWSNATAWAPDPTWAQMGFPANDNSTNVLYRATSMNPNWQSVDTNAANDLGIVQFFEKATNTVEFFKVIQQ